MKMKIGVIVFLLFCVSVSLASPRHIGDGTWAFITSPVVSAADWKQRVCNNDVYWQRYKQYYGLSCAKKQFLGLSWYQDTISGEVLIGVWKGGRPVTLTQTLRSEPCLVAIDSSGNKFVIIMDCSNPLQIRKVPCKVAAVCTTPCNEGSMDVSCGEVEPEQPMATASLLVTAQFGQVSSSFPVGTSGTTYVPLLSVGVTGFNNQNQACPKPKPKPPPVICPTPVPHRPW